MSKISYFVGGVMGLAIATTAVFGASAQGCFLSKSIGEGSSETTPSDTLIGDVAPHTHTSDGPNPLAVVAGLAGIGGLGAAGMMLKKGSAQANAEVSETPEVEYEVETVVTDVTAEVERDLEAGDRTLTSVG